MKLSKYIDHTKLGPTVVQEDIEKLCAEAIEHDFMSVCVDPVYVPLASKLLKDSSVLVCTVIGFPSGMHQSAVKAFEAKTAIQEGADEIDMVINIGALKAGNIDLVYEDIKAVKQACGKTLLKVIIETCFLTNEEKVVACELAKKANADFVKTSTGFATGGATVEDIKLMRATVKDSLGVKASGGVRSYEDAMNMINAGATRIGASSGIKIVNKKENKNDSNTSY